MHVILAAWYSPENWPYIALALLGLGFVIFVHELGHFLVAKMCGVKCEKFYVGFDVPIKLGWGKYAIRLPASLWKKQWGETEYGIGIIPLGGYVKMLGQDDNPGRQAEMMKRAKEQAEQQAEQGETPAAPAEGDENFVFDPRSYMAQSVPERMLIISAGVAMNIIFAFIFAMIAFGMGVPYTKCEVAFLSPGEPAWLSNLRPGDKIVEINGVKNPRFKDLQQEVILGDLENGIPLTVERPGEDGKPKLLEFTLTPHKEKIAKRKRAIIGVGMKRTLTLADERFVAQGSPAAEVASKLKGGDTIVAIDGEPVADYVEYLKVLAQKPDQEITVTFERLAEGTDADTANAEKQQVTVTVGPYRMRRLGVAMKPGPITAVQPGSPADNAGMKVGDELIAIDGEPVGDPIDLPESLRRRAGETVHFKVRRNGDDGPEELLIQAQLREPEWSNMLGETMEIPVLGAAYTVTAVVASAKSPKIQPGDRVVQVELVPANDEQRKKETDRFGKLKPIPIDGEEGVSWPYWVGVMQETEDDTKIRLTLQRGEKRFEVDLAAETDPNSVDPQRGFVLMTKTGTMKAGSLGEAISLGTRETKYAMLAVYRFLHKLLSGQISPQLLGGPGTIAAVAGMSAKEGWAELLIFLTLLSANLAVVNFLPIPVLDGGHMVFLILEAIFRRPVSEKIVIPLTYAGLFLILSLMVFVISLDINRFAM